MELKTLQKVQVDNLKGLLYSAGKQSMLVPIDFVKSINEVFENLVGEESSKVLIYKMGEGLGKGYIDSLKNFFDKEGKILSQEKKIKSACDTIFMESGWGKIEFLSLSVKSRTGVVEVMNSPSEKVLKSKDFDLERGILAGVFEGITKKKVFCEKGKKSSSKLSKGTILKIKEHSQEDLEDSEDLLLLTHKDFHEKVEQETQEIIGEKEKLEATIESMVDGLVMVDNDAKIVMINPQAEEYFNVQRKDVVERKLEETDLSKHLAEVYSRVKETTENRDNPEKIQPVLCSPREDRENFIAVSAKAVTSGNLKVIGYVLIARDVTREKLMERLKNEFISISAHQLRTPLTGIKWSLRMMLDNEIGAIDEEAASYLNKIYQTNEVMISLVNELLNVSRIEEGRFLYQLETVSLKEIAKKAIMEAEVPAERKAIKLEFKSEEQDFPKVNVDGDKIKLALQNLIENAIKYSKFGGTVTVHLKLDHSEEREYIQIEVSDSGIGIDEAEHQRVFTKFFRGENAARMHTQGSGLGLFIVKNIVQSHNGKIWFESKLNKGTTFFIRLPLQSDKNVS